MAMHHANQIEQFTERLAKLARKYGSAGEKPIAVWALTSAARQIDRRLTGLELVREHTDQVRAHFLRLADEYGRMKDAANSWSVITGSARELQRALTSPPEANEAFAHLDPEDLVRLEAWFQERSSAVGPVATSDIRDATDSQRAPRRFPPAPAGVGWEVRLSESATCVEGWSRFRLPFEPKGERIEYRERLKAAISGLRASSTAFIEAEYVSPSLPSNCDVENVLFYNVGAGAFASVARGGLSFAYRQGQGPPAPNGEIFNHYVRYRVQQRESLIHRSAGEHVVEISGVPIQRISSELKPHEIWCAMQRRFDQLSPTSAPSEFRSDFAVAATLYLPGSQSINTASIVKPLFDGIASALHWPDSRDEQLAGMVASQTGEPLATVGRWLTRPGPAIISRKHAVESYCGGVRWHPDDSRLKLGRIFPDYEVSATSATMSVSIYQI